VFQPNWPSSRTQPTDTLQNNSLMLIWDDLDPSEPNGEVWVQTLGTTPNQRFVIQYAGVRHDFGGAPNGINAEIILYEGTNIIESW
jgi:hypothetical protein